MPRIVWRVEPDASYCDVYGLQARGEPAFEDTADYDWQRQRHLNWDWSLESPSQSTFSCKIHAIRWGLQVYDKDATLYQIKTRGLRTDRGDQRDELLIVGDIPAKNVEKIMVLEDEYERMTERQRQRFEVSMEDDDEEEEEEEEKEGGGGGGGWRRQPRRRLRTSRGNSMTEVQEINRAINALEWIPLASEVPRGYLQHVCEASEDACDAYVESENQALRSRHLMWSNGSIFIAEFPSDVHGYISRGICFAIHDHPVVRRYLVSRGDSHNRSPGYRRYEPDESFRPSRVWLQSVGVGLPLGLRHWSDFVTLKIEVGVSRGWGDAVGCLDYKTRFVWSRFPGVAYVLCVVVDSDLQHAEFKCYAIPGLNTAPPLIARSKRHGRSWPSMRAACSGLHQDPHCLRSFRIRLRSISLL